MGLVFPLLVLGLGLALIWRGDALGWLVMLVSVVQAGWWLRLQVAPVPAPASTPLRDLPPDLLLGQLLPLWSAQLGEAQRSLALGMSELQSDFQAMTLACEQANLAVNATSGAGQTASDALVQAVVHGEAALHAMQVADRVHQQIDVIRMDQLRLAARLADLASLDDSAIAQWLADLKAQYTTDEQHRVHAGDDPKGASSGVEFF